ncbi:MAG: hypothetical protein A2V88_07835 [Elusimicrobia bacterium RBG_16_66_12]|nr:MAG: hypothetical protein A2V88_07835 [Elusimicrobia bacterium RBG_16_66_12]
MKTTPADIAVVMPLYNEAESVGRVLSELTEALRQAGPGRLEVVLVDDASTDDSGAAARKTWEGLAHGDLRSRLHVLRLAANAGNQAALTAGFQYAGALDCGLVFAMDSDGQDDPAALPEMIRLLGSHDIVFAERSRRNEPLLWRAGYTIYRLAFRALLGVDFPYGNFSGFRSEVLDFVLDMGTFRHLAAALSRSHYRKTSLRVPRRARLGGAPKMGLGALVDHGIAALTSYPDAWVRFFSRVALLTTAAAGAGGLVVVGIKLTTKLAIPGWASVMTLILSMIAFQAVGFLVISAFLSSVLDHQRARPARKPASAEVLEARR